MTPLISLVHTTARPGVCDETIRKLLLVTDRPELIQHCLTYEEKFFDGHPPNSPWPNLRVMPTNGTPIDGYNLAAEMSTGKILFFFADDCFPYLHWDSEFIDAFGQKIDEEAALLVDVVFDQGNGLEVAHDGISQFPTCTRPFYEYLKTRCGGFLNHCYFARYSDPEYSQIVKERIGFIDMRRKIRLRHYEERDKECVIEATRRKMMYEHNRDAQIFARRMREGFPPGAAHWMPEV